MNEAEIKSLMKEKKLTISGLARRFKKSRSSVHFLVKRQLSSKPMDRKLARAIGVKLDELRGERAGA